MENFKVENLSLCIINKNDAVNLERLIKTAKDYVGEIIVVDTGSIDRSIDIAKNFADIVYESRENEFSFEDGSIKNFGEARNKSFELATKSWIIWLDTDDNLSDWPGLKSDMQALELIRNQDSSRAHTMEMAYDYTWNNQGQCIQSFKRARIIHKNDEWFWHRPVHEYLKTNLKEIKYLESNNRVIHLSSGARGMINNRNKKILLDWIKQPGLSDEDISTINYYLGDEAFCRSEYKKGYEFFIKVVNVHRDRALFRAASCLINDSQYYEAIIFIAACTQQYHVANLYWLLAMANANLGRYKEANIALEHSKNYPLLIGEDPTVFNLVRNAISIQSL